MNKKIAILGKGGTGKSSVSWLLSNYLSQDKKIRTMAIDGDHNMDLSSCLGFDTAGINYLKDFNGEFRRLAGMPEIGMWKEYFKHEPIKFNYPNDKNLAKYIYSLNENLDIAVVGLGDEDNMFSNKCGHGFSAPLKYMLTTLELHNSCAVIDSVAGSDMINYGLYFGVDAILVVVEGHINSIKVAKQIQMLADKQGLEVSFIINKYQAENALIQQFIQDNHAKIVTRIPIDLAVLEYDYAKIKKTTKETLENIYQYLITKDGSTGSYNSLKQFENQKV
jgi:CO dehydrogenase maturation factor